MTRLALLLLQLATTNGPPPPDARAVEAPSRRDCGSDSGGIVVCARDRDTYRLPKTGPSIEAPMLPKAEWRLFGNATMGVNAEERSVGGWSAPAAMATVKIPF